MKLAFERASWRRWFTPYGVLDRIIGFWTQSPFCHVEVVFDREHNVCFSADIEQGVRFQNIGDLDDPKHWEVVSLCVTPEDEHFAYNYANTMRGRKYNELGLLRFVVGPIRDPTNRDFCSQVSLLVLEHIGLWSGVPADRVDPGFLYQMVTTGRSGGIT